MLPVFLLTLALIDPAAPSAPDRAEADTPRLVQTDTGGPTCPMTHYPCGNVCCPR